MRHSTSLSTLSRAPGSGSGSGRFWKCRRRSRVGNATHGKVEPPCHLCVPQCVVRMVSRFLRRHHHAVHPASVCELDGVQLVAERVAQLLVSARSPECTFELPVGCGMVCTTSSEVTFALGACSHKRSRRRSRWDVSVNTRNRVTTDTPSAPREGLTSAGLGWW